jgi:hypothetical protein
MDCFDYETKCECGCDRVGRFKCECCERMVCSICYYKNVQECKECLIDCFDKVCTLHSKYKYPDIKGPVDREYELAKTRSRQVYVGIYEREQRDARQERERELLLRFRRGEQRGDEYRATDEPPKEYFAKDRFRNGYEFWYKGVEPVESKVGMVDAAAGVIKGSINFVPK